MDQKYSSALRTTGLVFAVGLCPPVSSARSPEAGTSVTNVANVAYFNSRLGVTETLDSNTVSTVVNAVPGLDVLSDQTVLRAPGDNALFAFQIVNTGNTAIDVSAQLASFEGDFAFNRAIAWIDLNENGRIDQQDIRLDPANPVTIEIDSQVGILVDVLTPSTVTSGMRASTILSARLAGQDDDVSAIGEVVITEAAATLEKSASVIDNVAGGEIIYTLDLRNNSDGVIDLSSAIGPDPLTIDGVEQNLLIVRDEIPTNTSFQRIIDAVDFDPVFHRRGDAESDWLSEPPTDPTLIDAIAFVSDQPLPPQSSRDFRFSVTIADNAAGSTIENTAEVLLPSGGEGLKPTFSNTVTTLVEGAPGQVLFYADGDFTTPTQQLAFGASAFLEVTSGLCNVSQDIDSAEVTLLVSPSGDKETVTVVETAPNSGVFRISDLPTGDGSSIVPGDGVLQGPRNSTVSASVACDPDVSGDVALSPAGAVFFSTSNEPVPGAVVQLLDAGGNVIEERTTDVQGFYDLTPPTGGMHSIRVLPPLGFVTPSQRTNFTGFGRNVLQAASFAEPFAISAAGQTLSVDVPVDPEVVGALSVAKTGDRQDVEIGDFIEYSVEVRNNSSVAVQQAEIVDVLPNGLDLVGGSVLLNGGPLADPVFSGGRNLVFEVGLLPPNSTLELTYTARVLPTAGEGDLTNLAFARGELLGFDEVIESNTASFTVDVDSSEGVFSRDGVILGKVFLDCDADGKQGGPHEPGIPGVQIFTQEGLWAVTDHAGRYSLSQLDPRTHVLDVRESSLPDGTSVTRTRVFDAGAAGSRFVKLQAGEIRAEDFAVAGCQDDIIAEIEARSQAFGSYQNGGSALIQPETARPFNAVTGAAQNTQQSVPALPTLGALPEAAISSPAEEGVQNADLSLAQVLEQATDELAFVGLSDGDHRIRRSASFKVVAPAALTLELLLDEVPVATDRIAEKLATGASQAVDYVAVPLSAGENTLTLVGRDGFGNVRQTKTITITAPGEPARLEIEAPPEVLADPSRPVPLKLQVVDAEGRPAAAATEATLHARDDAFDVRDASEQQPGLQTLINDGYIEVDLIPSETVGTRTITVESPFGRAEARIRFTPSLDTDGIAVGFAEAAFGLGGDGASGLPNVFREDEISPFEDTEEGVETSFFLKGRILKDALLTLRHDSARDVDDELFRTVEPDEFYPIYGDQSQRGFDAQSRGKTFAKIERGSSYVQFGDVAYAARSQALQLGAFQRTIEGAQSHLELGRLSLDLYLGRTDTGQIIVEQPALGISGPYPLDFDNVLENSETVELVTRDRDQPDVIIRTERLGRFSAYTLDFFNRTLIFNRPIPSRDENLNPISIRVTFETETGEGEDYWVFGGEAEVAVTDWLSAGYRQLTSDGPDGTPDDQTVRATYLAAQVGARGRLEIEAAQSINPEDESGLGIRLNFEQQTNRGTFGARLATTGEGFDAPNASVGAGRDEARLFGSLRAGPGTLTGEALFTADKASDAERYGIVARYETALGSQLRLRGGSRYINDVSGNGDREDALTVIVGAGWSPGFISGLSLDVEAEQEVTEGAQSRVSVGADYAVSTRARLYAQADYTGSQSGSFGLTDSFNDDVTFRLGGEYRWSERVSAFSELRANDSFLDSGVANGLTIGWAPVQSLSLRARTEHVQPIGTEFAGNTAVALGFTWAPEGNNRILDHDIEYSIGNGGQQSWFISTSAGQRFGDLTFLVRNRFAQTLTAGERRERDRLRLGAAHRPQSNDRINALAWYEYETDDQGGFEEQRHIWSLGGEWKPGALIRWRGRFAGQQYVFQNDVLNEESTTLLAQFGGEWDLFDRVNAAVTASFIGDTEIENFTWGVGGELNVNVLKNALLGVGYNYAALEEDRFGRLFRGGTFIRLRAKFDQSLWNIFE